MKKIVNCETGEVIERELTDEEIAQQNKDEAESNAKQLEEKKEAEAKAAARQTILDRLGLTEEEAKLLLG